MVRTRGRETSYAREIKIIQRDPYTLKVVNYKPSDFGYRIVQHEGGTYFEVNFEQIPENTYIVHAQDYWDRVKAHRAQKLKRIL